MYVPQSDQEATCHCVPEGQFGATRVGVKQTHGLHGKFPAASNSRSSACRACCMTISTSFEKEARSKVVQHGEE